MEERRLRVLQQSPKYIHILRCKYVIGAAGLGIYKRKKEVRKQENTPWFKKTRTRSMKKELVQEKNSLKKTRSRP